jgi:transcriptional regulator with XRE-family HTH domain
VSIGALIHHYRIAAGLSVAQLARRAELTEDSLRKLERGAIVHPRIDTLLSIARGLNVDHTMLVPELLEAEENTGELVLPKGRAHLPKGGQKEFAPKDKLSLANARLKDRIDSLERVEESGVVEIPPAIGSPEGTSSTEIVLDTPELDRAFSLLCRKEKLETLADFKDLGVLEHVFEVLSSGVVGSEESRFCIDFFRLFLVRAEKELVEVEEGISKLLAEAEEHGDKALAVVIPLFQRAAGE